MEDSPIAPDVRCNSSGKTAPCLEERPPQTEEEDPAVSLSPYLEHHLSNSDTNTTVQSEEHKRAIPELDMQEAKGVAKILSPNPISPAHQLRVTNSIPQLMKALPPLPYETQDGDDKPCLVSSKNTEVHTDHLIVTNTANTSIAVQPGTGTGEPSLETAPCDKNLGTSFQHQIHTQTHSNPLRFKLRVKSSQSSGLHSKWSTEPLGVQRRSSSSPIKPKLKLKVSRNRMSGSLMSSDDANVPSDGLRQHNSLLVLENISRREVSLSRSSFREALEEQLARLSSDKPLSNIYESTTRGHSTQISDQFDISIPSPTRGIVPAELVLQPKLERGLDSRDRVQQDSSGILNSKPSRDKAPRLRRHGAPSAKGGKSRCLSNGHEINSSPLCPNDVSRNVDKSTLAPSQTTVMSSQRLLNKTRRVKRWLKEVKLTLRKLMSGTRNR